MGKVVTMPWAARPEQIASLIPRSRNGVTACGSVVSRVVRVF